MERKLANLFWILITLVSIIGALAIIVSVWFGGRYYSGNYGPYNMMGGFYGMGIIMPIIGVISLIFVLIFIFFIFGAFDDRGREHVGAQSTRAEEIAKERFAKGEISESEYNSLVERLRK